MRYLLALFLLSFEKTFQQVPDLAGALNVLQLIRDEIQAMRSEITAVKRALDDVERRAGSMI